MSDTGFGRRRSAPRFGFLAVAIVVVLAAILGLIALTSGYTKTSGGEVAVVRNGGPLDNNKIRQIIEPASSRTWSGLFSTAHRYPSQQRFYTITADSKRGDRSGVDVVQIPTSDGVDVGIEGTIYFSLSLDPQTLRDFDNKFGTRPYTGADGKQHNAYDGNDGWSAFLDTIIRPVIDNDLREQINNVRCSELVSSCALVQNNASNADPSTAKAVSASNNGTIKTIQDNINVSLVADLKETLGGNYLTGIKFNLVRVTLPQAVQDAVNKAQAAFAQVTEAQARVASAQADADANKKRQEGYQNCPACAQIDELKAIPPSVTTFAPGAGFAVTPGK